ncbi:hypothetical protein PIB30_096864, partial [Stylosanthes scabra]|nr:hypothetical protein [Stylosanthes scabra]
TIVHSTFTVALQQTSLESISGTNTRLLASFFFFSFDHRHQHSLTVENARNRAFIAEQHHRQLPNRRASFTLSLYYHRKQPQESTSTTVATIPSSILISTHPLS